MNIFHIFTEDFFQKVFDSLKTFSLVAFFYYSFFSVTRGSRRVRNLVYWGVPGDKTDRDMSDQGH